MISYQSQAVRVAVLLAGYDEVQSYRNLSCYNYLKTGLQQSSKIVRRFSVLVASALAEPIPWIIAVSLGSCTSNALSTNGGSSQKQLQVITTFIPITDFTKAVAGNRAQVTQLLPTNVDPHDYQAKPEDAQKLAKADVLVENGLEMEGCIVSIDAMGCHKSIVKEIIQQEADYIITLKKNQPKLYNRVENLF